jgi:hypothetical protein
VADLQLFRRACAGHGPALFLIPEQLQPERPALTPRELEALRWTMEGKTAWEVGHPGHQRAHGGAARAERDAQVGLRCNKHQAVLKALRLGLIH